MFRLVMRLLKIFALCALALVVGGFVSRVARGGSSAAVAVAAAATPAPTCSAKNVHVTVNRARFVDKCLASHCYVMAGAATLENACATPIRAEVEITGYDHAGKPVATRREWPFSTDSIEPGAHVFSLDQALDYDSHIASFSVTPVNVLAR